MGIDNAIFDRGLMSPENVQAIAAVATFLAALVAVWATFRAPKIAAEFAEELRRSSSIMEEQRKLKLQVFTTLLQYRAQIVNPNSVAALNLIDVIFVDSKEVRQSWKDFNDSTNAIPYSANVIVERYHGIINCIARDLGLSDKISISDIRNSYYPEGLGKLDEVANLEVDHKLSTLRQSKPS